MDLADALIFLLLAWIDLCILVLLRRRRSRVLRKERMMHSLDLHVRRMNGAIQSPQAARLAKAS